MMIKTTHNILASFILVWQPLNLWKKGDHSLLLMATSPVDALMPAPKLLKQCFLENHA